jgi:hypothetical protein
MPRFVEIKRPGPDEPSYWVNPERVSFVTKRHAASSWCEIVFSGFAGGQQELRCHMSVADTVALLEGREPSGDDAPGRQDAPAPAEPTRPRPGRRGGAAAEAEPAKVVAE